VLGEVYLPGGENSSTDPKVEMLMIAAIVVSSEGEETRAGSLIRITKNICAFSKQSRDRKGAVTAPAASNQADIERTYFL